MLPSIESLRCFEAAARTLHFRSAARAVALTPAAFGERIKKLEDDLGVSLFARTTRSVQLTREGLTLLPLARTCLMAAEACATLGEKAQPPLTLRLGTRHELGLSFVVPSLDVLHAKLPHLEVNLYFGSGQDLLLRLRSFDIDCAITSSVLTDPKLDAQKLHREDYVLVARADLARTIRKPQDTAAHALLDSSPELPLFRYFRDAVGSPSLGFARTVSLGTIEAIRMRVLAGAGVAVLPAYHVRRDLEKKRIVRLFPKIVPVNDHFRLVYRKDDVRRPVYDDVARVLAAETLR